MYKYSFITDDTCKCHIVDCLRLGVVPVIDENCRVLEIEDVVSGEEEWKEDHIHYTKKAKATNIGNRDHRAATSPAAASIQT